MTFKEWLISEEAVGGETGSNFFYGLQLYPSDAFDYEPATRNPQEHYFLQRRWQIEKKQGRTFHGIDYDGFQSRDYTTVSSTSMPDGGPGFWRHKPDRGSSVKVERVKKMIVLGDAKTSKQKNPAITKSNPPLVTDLDRIFGDKGTSSVSQLSQDFDKAWKKVYENVTAYIDIGQWRPVNANMGIASKYAGPDETGEKRAQVPVKTADFGLDPKKRRSKHKYGTTIWRNKFNG